MNQIGSQLIDDPVVTRFVSGLGPSVLPLNAMVAEVATTGIPILIWGESGTGKDTYARLIHRLSKISESKLYKISCAAVGMEDLLAQVHEAAGRNPDQGTSQGIYLDNIQDLDLGCQRVLLSHLPDGENARPGEELQTRLISSTTRNLEEEVEAGRFRGELYFRISGVCLRLPPLRERSEDIPILMDYFLNKHSSALGKKAPAPSTKALQTLVSYRWPGNIRELENLARKIVVFGDVQRAMNDLETARIVNHRPDEAWRGTSSLKVAARAASRQAERELIIQALERTRWNRKRAARELQISYKSLLYKIKQIGSLTGGQEG